MLPQFLLLFLAISVSTHLCISSSVYEVLRSNGLPMGLLPNGVNDFRLDGDGKFVAYLDQECNAKYENELHYDRNVSGFLSYGQIANLSGISAQDLFLWFPVKEIRVDVPSSGLIYFDVGVVSKQFSLSMFETPRDCTAVPPPEVLDGGFVAGIAAKVINLLGFGLLASLFGYFWCFGYWHGRLHYYLRGSSKPHGFKICAKIFIFFDMRFHFSLVSSALDEYHEVKMNQIHLNL